MKIDSKYSLNVNPLWSDTMSTDDLNQTYYLIKKIINDLSEEQLKLITPINKRSIFGIIFHLDYFEQTYVSNVIRNFMYIDPLYFLSFKEESSWNYWCRDITINQLESFRRERERNLDLISLCDKSISNRTAMHEIKGEIDFNYCIDITIKHDNRHLQQIEKIKEFILSQK